MEERTLDDDIEKGLKLKKKEDGDETISEETENEEEIVLDIPVIEEDNEELADMTPEQAAAYIKQREEEQAKLLERKDDLKAEAAVAEENGESDRAEELYYNVLELDPADLVANVGYARKITKDFSVYDDFSFVKDTYKKGVDNAGDDFVAAIKDTCEKNIRAEIGVLKGEEEELYKKVEEKRSARREAFKADYNVKKKAFLRYLIMFVVFTACAVVFALNISSFSSASAFSTVFLVLTIAFGVVALASLVMLLRATNKFSTAAHRVKENERDGATKDGQALIAIREKIEFLSSMIA